MNRRALLSSLGSGAAGLAGCSSILGSERTPTLSPVDVEATATQTPTRSGETADCAGPDSEYLLDHPPLEEIPTAPEQFADVGCPSFSQARETVCYHRVARVANPAEAPVLLVGGRTVDVAGESAAAVEFVLLNGSSESVRIRPDAWAILEPNGGDWQTVLSGDPGCIRTLAAQGFHYWQFGLGTAVTDSRVNVTATALSRLPDGVYVVAISVLYPDDDSIVCAAPFAVRRGMESPADGGTKTGDEFETDPAATETETPSPTAEEL